MLTAGRVVSETDEETVATVTSSAAIVVVVLAPAMDTPVLENTVTTSVAETEAILPSVVIVKSTTTDPATKLFTVILSSETLSSAATSDVKLLTKVM